MKASTRRAEPSPSCTRVATRGKLIIRVLTHNATTLDRAAAYRTGICDRHHLAVDVVSGRSVAQIGAYPVRQREIFGTNEFAHLQVELRLSAKGPYSWLPRPTSTLDGLARTSARLFDDCLLPDETVKIRDEARLFAERVLAPAGPQS